VKFANVFAEAAGHWQPLLNTGAMVEKVRFAQVDCAIDKVLCNEQGVVDYPMVAHYRDGVQTQIKGINLKNIGSSLNTFIKSTAAKVEVEEPRRIPREDADRTSSWKTVKLCMPFGLDLLLTILALTVSLRLVLSSSPDKSNPAEPMARSELPQPSLRARCPRSIIEI